MIDVRVTREIHRGIGAFDIHQPDIGVEVEIVDAVHDVAAVGQPPCIGFIPRFQQHAIFAGHQIAQHKITAIAGVQQLAAVGCRLRT
ncbi:MAG: hypothetical protein VX268_02295, partial [Actinomycetota bacterium]|nr:hypothetical protein [Actinomycetota bacterium]